MLNDLLIWVALLVGLVFLVVDKRRRIGALTLAYFLALSLGHVPGLLAYLDPNLLGDGEPTKVGFDITLIGMTAFIVGAMAARILPQRTTNVKAFQTASADIKSKLGWRLLTIGIVSYFLILPVSAMVPSLTAVASVLGSLLILGFWLQLDAARNKNDSRRTLLILAMLPSLPLATLATGGFIGFGTVWALSVASFFFVIARRRIWFYLAAPLVVFLGLSLFVTYFQERDDIREVVWDQSTGMMQRIDSVSKLITDFQLLDLSNEWHLFALDERLNQNYLVGVGVTRHRQGETELVYGATLPYWALIPRAIWPDKPSVGGGGDVVTKFTGITFAEGTSVGTGQVLEFYMNFGIAGVLSGFFVLGIILMRLDQSMMRALAICNAPKLLRAALPGLALLQPLGNLLEILVAVVSAIIVSHFLVRLRLLRFTQRPKTEMSGQTMWVIPRR
jgi:hypothetical protein